MPVVPETKSAWVDNVDALNSTNLNAYLRDPVRFIMNRPYARLTQIAAQSIASGATFVPVTFTGEEEDVDPDAVGGHSTSTNTSRYTARYPGVYLLGGGVGFPSNATGTRGCAWLLNGSLLDGSDVMIPAAPTPNWTRVPARSWSVRLDIGDYVELGANQNSGVALSTVLGASASSMHVAWLRL